MGQIENMDRSEELQASTSLVPRDLKIIDLVHSVNPLLVTLSKPESMEAEGFYSLRHATEKLRGREKTMTIGVTSPMNGEGKTLVAGNLAGALARDKANRVLLIDLDLRNGENSIVSYLGLDLKMDRGVVNSVKNNDTIWENATYFITEYNFYVMPSGERLTMPYEVLNSPALGQLLNGARAFFDYIIIDSPPVLALTDTRLIAQWINGFMMLVTSGITSHAKLAEALDIVGPEKMLGLVFNRYK